MNPPISAPAIKLVKSVREQVSAEEWSARVNLAACYRLTAMYGMTEMIANHISCRVPGHHDQFLINPYGMLYEEIDASCLIKVDVEGNTLFNQSDYNVNVAGFVIHSAIHMARHDVDCVAHTHTPAGKAKFQDVRAQLQKELQQNKTNQLRSALDKKLKQNAKIEEL